MILQDYYDWQHMKGYCQAQVILIIKTKKGRPSRPLGTTQSAVRKCNLLLGEQYGDRRNNRLTLYHHLSQVIIHHRQFGHR